MSRDCLWAMHLPPMLRDLLMFMVDPPSRPASRRHPNLVRLNQIRYWLCCLRGCHASGGSTNGQEKGNEKGAEKGVVNVLVTGMGMACNVK